MAKIDGHVVGRSVVGRSVVEEDAHQSYIVVEILEEFWERGIGAMPARHG